MKDHSGYPVIYPCQGVKGDAYVTFSEVSLD